MTRLRTLSPLIGLLTSASLAAAADLSTNATTILRFHQRDMGLASRTYLPATQFLKADVGSLGSDRLSLHLYGWGRADLADQSEPNGTANGFLDQAYLQYSHPTANAFVRLGRITSMESGQLEQFDGISLRSDLLQSYKGLALSLFAGKPVSQGKGTSVRGDLLYGGRLSYRFEGRMEAGLFLTHESGMLRTGPASDLKDYRSWLGGDLWLRPLDGLEIEGRSLYDDVGGDFAENRVRVALSPSKELTISAEYRQNSLDSLFSSTNLRTLFSPDRTESSSTFSGSVTYRFPLPLEVTVDASRTDRDSRSGSTSIGFSARSANGPLTMGGSYHHLTSGKLNGGSEGFVPPDSDQIRLFALYSRDSWSVGADTVLDLYSSKIGSKDRSIETTATGGYQLAKAFRLSLDLTHADTPLVNDELRALARLSMNFE